MCRRRWAGTMSAAPFLIFGSIALITSVSRLERCNTLDFANKAVCQRVAPLETLPGKTACCLL